MAGVDAADDPAQLISSPEHGEPALNRLYLRQGRMRCGHRRHADEMLVKRGLRQGATGCGRATAYRRC